MALVGTAEERLDAVDMRRGNLVAAAVAVAVDKIGNGVVGAWEVGSWGLVMDFPSPECPQYFLRPSLGL